MYETCRKGANVRIAAPALVPTSTSSLALIRAALSRYGGRSNQR